MNEISNIGWGNLEAVNGDFTEIQLKSTDQMNRVHILTVKLTRSVPEVHVELPGNFIWNQVCFSGELFHFDSEIYLI